MELATKKDIENLSANVERSIREIQIAVEKAQLRESTATVTLDEAAELLRTSRKKVSKLPIQKIRVGRSIRILVSDLKIYLETCKQSTK